jgi:hypothetical protein
MLTLRDYVNWGIAHSDNVGKAEGVPLVMEKCKRGRKMKQLEIYGNSVQDGTPSPEAPVEVESVGEPVTDKNDNNYGKYKIPVVLMGKNLYNAGLYPMKDGIYINGTNGAEGGGTNATLCGVRDYIPCENLIGKTITISPVSGNTAGVAFYDEQKVYVLGVPHSLEKKGYITVTVPENAHYYRFSSVIAEREAAQVEFGDAPTGYEPYIEPVTANIYLNEPLRKIGDYADILDFKNRKVIRNIYENDFDDINNTSLYSISIFDTASALLCFRIKYRGDKLKYAMASINVKGNACCNMYPVVTSEHRTEDTLSGGAGDSATFDFIDSDYTTQEAWIAHINELTANGTPLKVIHTLKAPYEEAIICELPTLNAKTTVIDIDTSIFPSNIKGKYIKR